MADEELERFLVAAVTRQASDSSKSIRDHLELWDKTYTGLSSFSLAEDLGVTEAELERRINEGLTSANHLARACALSLRQRWREAVGAATAQRADILPSITRLRDTLRVMAIVGENDPSSADPLEIWRSAAALFDDRTEPLVWADAHVALADALMDNREFTEAERVLGKVVEIRTSELGESDFATLLALSRVCKVRRQQNNYAGAVEALKRCQQIMSGGLECERGPDTRALFAEAFQLFVEGKFAEAELVYRKILAVDAARLGDDHTDIAVDMSNLAGSLIEQDKTEPAEKLFRKALDILYRHHKLTGAAHQHEFAVSVEFGKVLSASGLDLEEAAGEINAIRRKAGLDTQ